MRTIRIELHAPLDDGGKMVISTEVVIGNDDELADAGREANAALTAFLNAYAEPPE